MIFSVDEFFDKKGNVDIIPSGHDEIGLGRNLNNSFSLVNPYSSMELGEKVIDAIKYSMMNPFICSKDTLGVHMILPKVKNWADYTRNRISVKCKLDSVNGFTFEHWLRLTGGAYGIYGSNRTLPYTQKLPLETTAVEIGETIIRVRDASRDLFECSKVEHIRKIYDEKVVANQIKEYIKFFFEIVNWLEVNKFEKINMTLLLLLKNKYISMIKHFCVDIEDIYNDFESTIRLYKQMELISDQCSKELLNLVYTIDINSYYSIDLNKVAKYDSNIISFINEILMNLSNAKPEYIRNLFNNLKNLLTILLM